MANGRRTDGRETWQRLREWDKGQAPSERLAAQILISEKFESIDPSHPLGGRDGGKDILCKRNGIKYVVACYFPRGQQTNGVITSKFQSDLEGIAKNNVDGIVFVTNQELTLGERDGLSNLLSGNENIEIYHLERIASILNAPINYGTRLEYLEIEMTKEEQLSFMAAEQQKTHDLINIIKQLTNGNSPKTEISSSPVKVTVEKFSAYSSLGGIYGSPIHKCSNCGYGFLIAGRTIEYGAITVRTTSQYDFDLGIPKGITVEYVTCPKCGNKDKLSEPF